VVGSAHKGEECSKVEETGKVGRFEQLPAMNSSATGPVRNTKSSWG